MVFLNGNQMHLVAVRIKRTLALSHAWSQSQSVSATRIVTSTSVAPAGDEPDLSLNSRAELCYTCLSASLSRPLVTRGRGGVGE